MDPKEPELIGRILGAGLFDSTFNWRAESKGAPSLPQLEI